MIQTSGRKKERNESTVFATSNTSGEKRYRIQEAGDQKLVNRSRHCKLMCRIQYPTEPSDPH